MTTYSTVACAEEHNTATTSFDATTGSVTAQVTLRCAFADRFALVQDLLGSRRLWPHMGTANRPWAIWANVRNPPAKHIPIAQVNTYDEALVDVRYGVPISQAIGDFPEVSETVTPAAKFTKLDHRVFRWASVDGDPLRKEEAPGKLEVRLQLTRRITNLPQSLLPANTYTAIGKTNIATYTSPLLGVAFEPETLLYLEPEVTRVLGTANSGTQVVSYTQKWVWNPNGWNKYWRSEVEQYQYIYRSSRVAVPTIPYRSYEPVDFSGLLA